MFIDHIDFFLCVWDGASVNNFLPVCSIITMIGIENEINFVVRAKSADVFQYKRFSPQFGG